MLLLFDVFNDARYLVLVVRLLGNRALRGQRDRTGCKMLTIVLALGCDWILARVYFSLVIVCLLPTNWRVELIEVNLSVLGSSLLFLSLVRLWLLLLPISHALVAVLPLVVGPASLLLTLVRPFGRQITKHVDESFGGIVSGFARVLLVPRRLLLLLLVLRVHDRHVSCRWHHHLVLALPLRLRLGNHGHRLAVEHLRRSRLLHNRSLLGHERLERTSLSNSLQVNLLAFLLLAVSLHLLFSF